MYNIITTSYFTVRETVTSHKQLRDKITKLVEADEGQGMKEEEQLQNNMICQDLREAALTEAKVCVCVY